MYHEYPVVRVLGMGPYGEGRERALIEPIDLDRMVAVRRSRMLLPRDRELRIASAMVADL